MSHKKRVPESIRTRNYDDREAAPKETNLLF